MPLQIFLCYAKNDKVAVRQLYERLRDAGYTPWLDEEELLPGQDWEQEIRKAVRASDVVVACLSRESIAKSGFVQKEIRFALDVADEQPEGKIFLIPTRLEECVVPDRLRKWQWVDMHAQNGFASLLRSLKLRSGSTVKDFPDDGLGYHAPVFYDEYDESDAEEERDELFRQAALLCITAKHGDEFVLARGLNISYSRATRIIDQLHFAGVLGPPDGSKPRDVLVDIIGLDQLAPED